MQDGTGGTYRTTSSVSIGGLSMDRQRNGWDFVIDVMNGMGRGLFLTRSESVV